MKIVKIIGIFLKATGKEKREIIKYFYKKAKQRFVNYFLGFVDINKYYIDDIDGNTKLYKISIIAGKYGKGVCFSQISAEHINNIMNKLKEKKSKLELTIDYGCGTYQTYTFNKYQQKCLLKELEKIILTEKIYCENQEMKKYEKL
ncbi:hypothetical protein [Thermoanaerobacterium thermosaccharolyticum]|uniref:hypothetical protein n=1 Tax=Thermoanaerobacterium thermosaccharolyticum TaxID=1517 RepID=UPI003DA88656